MSVARRQTTPKRPRRGLVIGPSDGGADVDVVISRPPTEQTAPAGAERAPARSGPAGYAHVNRWRLNEHGAATKDTVAQLLADELERQPGFVSYALVRTDAREVVAVTIFETEAQLRRAMETVAPVMRRHVLPLAAAKPERRRGVVLHYRAAR